MSDARFREIERRWKAEPSPELAMQYLQEIVRADRGVDLLDIPGYILAQKEINRYLEDMKRVRFAGRSFPGVVMNLLNERQRAFDAGSSMAIAYGLVNAPLDIITYAEENYGSDDERRTNIIQQWSLHNALEIALPEPDLSFEIEYEIIALYWVAQGAPIRSGSLSNALTEEGREETEEGVEYKLQANTKEPYLFAVIRTSHTTEITDELQDTTEEIDTNRYYSVYYRLRGEKKTMYRRPLPEELDWTVIPRSGYIYDGISPNHLGVEFNHGNQIYRLFGDLNKERDDAECTQDEINSAMENVDRYRESISQTIDQTFIDVHEERGFASVTLFDRFTDSPIIDWHDQAVFELIDDGFFHGPFNANTRGEFHQSVYEYAESHGLLPWQGSEGETGHMRNPTEHARSWHISIGPAPFKKTTIAAFGTFEALSKAALHFGVSYDREDVEYGVEEETRAPMLTVQTHDGRWLQIWQNIQR